MFKWLEKNLPKIVMAPAVGLIGWFVYGFVLWTYIYLLQIQKYYQNMNYGDLDNMKNYGLLENGLFQ